VSESLAIVEGNESSDLHIFVLVFVSFAWIMARVLSWA
jgi:hypothetical protein